MRQGQQNRRGRGRGRKVQNPLSRNYESSGPEVKIRGNAAHIAEKYAALARDAAASGDSVTAENYLQHAEHYNRIIMAAQSHNAGGPQASEGANGSDVHRGQSAEDDGGATRRSSPPANGGEAEPETAEAAEDGKANGSGGGPEKVRRSKGADKVPPDNAAA